MHINYLVLDFETRSTVDISKSSRLRYCSDPTTDVLCIGLKHGVTVRVATPQQGPVFASGDPCPPEVLHCLRHGKQIIAHNAQFEMGIWKHVCVDKLGWPEIPYELWEDTMPTCLYFSLPRKLQKVAEALNLRQQKDMAGNKAMLQVSKPRSYSAKQLSTWVEQGNRAGDIPLRWWEDEERLNRVYSYCGDDVRAQDELFQKLGPLPDSRKAEYDFDHRVNQRGIPIDWANVYVASKVIQESMAEYNRELARLTASHSDPMGSVTAVSQIKQIAEYCSTHGYPMTKVNEAGELSACVDKEAVDKALQDPACPPQVKAVLAIRQAAGKSSLGKLESILTLTNPNSRVQDSMLWHGANTGRKAGQGIQPHNFPSRNCLKEKDADVLHEALSSPDPGTALANAMLGPLRKDPPQAIPDIISAGLRSFIKAEPGKMLYVSDFATIEVRNLAWTAGCALLNNAFATKQCVYRQFAGMLYHVDPHSIAKDDPKRQMGKIAVLGLGYGMGELNFQETCWVQYGIRISLSEALFIKNLYRSTYPEVMTFHRSCEKAFRKAIREKTSVPCGRVTFGCNGEWGWIVLPSGRPLWFREPVVRQVPNKFRGEGTMSEISYMGVHPERKNWTRRSTYGGSLVESICQGITACILQEAMVRVENAGYPVILTVHDEVVTEPEEHKDLDEFNSLMKVRPAWCLDLPIEVESCKRKRYGK